MPLMIAAAFGAWLASMVLGGAPWPTGKILGAIGVASAGVWLAPLQRSTNILESPRFLLLPDDARGSFFVRAVIGRPLRAVLAAVTLAISSAAVVRPAVGFIYDITALACWIAIIVALAQLVDDIERSHPSAAVLHVIPIILIGGMLPVFGTGPGPRNAQLVIVPHAVRFLFDGTGAKPALVGLMIVVLVMLVAVARWIETIPVLPRAPISAGRRHRRADRLIARIFSRSPAALAMAAARTTRVRSLQVAVFGSAVCICLAILARVPALALLFMALWLAPLYNTLGADVPLEGILRYVLLGVTTKRATTYQHMVMIAVLTGTSLAIIVAALAADALATPIVGPRTRWMYMVVVAYAESALLLMSISGAWFSRRHARAVPLTAIFPSRGYSRSAITELLQFVSWIVTVAMAAGLFQGSFIVLRDIVVVETHSRILLTTLMATMMSAALYALNSLRSGHAAGD
ncbi:MAG: hypothetical protein ABJE47_07515 [bacterium]